MPRPSLSEASRGGHVLNERPPRRTQQQRRAESRSRLLAAARELFERDGFAATSLSALAARAGYSKGAVYAQFASKDDVFLALLEELSEQRTAALARGADRELPPAELAAALAAAHAKTVREEPAWSLLMVEYAAHAARRPDLAPRLAEVNARVRSRLAGLVGDTGLSAHIDPLVYADAILVVTSGVALERLVDPGAVPDDVPARLALYFERGLQEDARHGP